MKNKLLLVLATVFFFLPASANVEIVLIKTSQMGTEASSESGGKKVDERSALSEKMAKLLTNRQPESRTLEKSKPSDMRIRLVKIKRPNVAKN